MGHRSYTLNGRVHNAIIVRFFEKMQSRRCSRKKKEKKSEFLLSRMCGSKDPYFGRYLEKFFDNCFEIVFEIS